MKRKLILICVAISLFANFKFEAASLYANNGTEVGSDGNVCANDSYFYKTSTSGMFEADIIDSSKKLLLATANAKNGEIELIFPTNASELKIDIYEYKNQQRNLVDTLTVKVSDCGYEVVREDYVFTAPLTKIVKTEEGYQFTEPENKGYKLYLNQLEEDDNGASKKVKFKDKIATVEKTSDIIQISEVYENKNGKQVTSYYEIDFTNDQFIRKINNVDLNIIEPMEYLDKNIMMRILFSLLILVVLFLLKVILSKRYNARKEYLRKYKIYQEKQRAMAKQKKLKELELKKRKEQALRQKQLESERRANLGIRK